MRAQRDGIRFAFEPRDDRHQDVEHRLLPGLRLAACCNGLDRGLAAGMQGCGVESTAGQPLPSCMNSVPYSGPEAPPTFITSVSADAGKQRSRVAGCERIEIGEHGFETTFHVQAMVTVADRLVELRQFVGVRDDATGQRFDDRAGEGDVHANVVSLQCGVLRASK